MQTIASLVERLDMSAEEAVEKLRYMMFEVDGVESEISDEECDLLIDIEDDPEMADKVREAKLKEIEKAKKRNERLRKAAKKAAAKRKAKKAKEEAEAEEARRKAEEEAAKAAEGAEPAPVAEILPPAEETAEEAAAPLAEILPAESEAPPARETLAEEAPRPEEAAKAEPKRKKAREKAKAKDEDSITIGRAIEHDEKAVVITRADGTPIDVPDVEASEVEGESALQDTQDAEDAGEELPDEVALAEEEEEKRRARHKPLAKPDPAVVAEVIRKASERKHRAQPPGARTGKSARKRQKKAEKARNEETLRKQAAATVREMQAGAGKRRKRRRTRDEDGEAGAMVDDALRPRVVEFEETITVEQLAEQLDESVNDIILELMDHDVMATKNQELPLDLVQRVTEPRGYEVRSVIPEETALFFEEPDDPATLVPRPPVVTVMGHVDHGKTTLLDRVREANVAEGEFGGITQHIAAYEVDVPSGTVVFLDTPGHEAFTQMRARGADVTDVVVLVVAADDGVMPQTAEAIDHAKAAGVPIVVAVNKCDKPDAQPERIRQELTRYELVDEKWGGSTIMRDISALHGEGVTELMELLVLETELLELKANPNKPGRGAVIESELTKGMGPVAWILVQNGTLKVGETILAGSAYGRIRTMLNSRGENLAEAGPSTPVAVTGLNGLPDAGDMFVSVKDERIARGIAEKRADFAKRKQGAARHMTLEDFHERMLAGEKQELNVVLKADVQGSVDVLASSLAKVGNEEVRVNIVHSGVGGINDSDVFLASASDAVIIGFHVVANPRVQKVAADEGVDLRTYRIIYECIEDVRKALEGMLKPESREAVTGHAEIRAVFRSSSLGNIAGCYVQDGEVDRSARVRILRDDVVIHDGKVATLRREKDDVRTVQNGYECGIKVENYDDIKEGDTLEFYRIESVAKTLA